MPSWSWVRRGPGSRQNSEGTRSGRAGGSAAGSSVWPTESLPVGPSGLGLREPDPSLPAPPVPLPRVSLVVARLYVAGSKPRRPRVCLTSTLTLCSGMATVPFSAEPSSVLPGRVPDSNPAAGSVPQARLRSGSAPRAPLWPSAQAGPAAGAPWGLVLPQSPHSTRVVVAGGPARCCAVTPVSSGGQQRHVW